MLNWTLEPEPSQDRSYSPAGRVLPSTFTSSYNLTVAFSPANAAEARRREAPKRRPLLMFLIFIKSPLERLLFCEGALNEPLQRTKTFFMYLDGIMREKLQE